MLAKLASTILVAALFALSLSVTPGCAAVAPYLPTVISAVTDGGLLLQTIERFADRYFEKRPDPDLQKKADVAIARVRSALDLALRAANAADAHNQANVDRAMAEVRLAYNDLVALLGPIGLMVAKPGGSLKAAPGTLVVPEPLALTLRVGQ